MKIKTTKQMRLDELIKYVWDNNLRNRAFIPKTPDAGDHGYIVRAGVNGGIEFDNQGLFVSQPFQFYVVEVEEELTEDTLLQDVKLIGLTRKGGRRVNYEMSEWSCPLDARTSISGIKRAYDLKSLHKVNRDGSLTLLYTEEHGIPIDGVLEVD